MEKPCKSVISFGLDTYFSTDCSPLAECLPTGTNGTTVCDCSASQNLLGNSHTTLGECAHTKAAWVLFALHLLLAVCAVPVFARLMAILRRKSGRLLLIHDAVLLSAVATAALALRCVAISAQIAFLNGSVFDIVNYIFVLLTMFLFFSFTLSLVIYALVVAAMMNPTLLMDITGTAHRKSLRRKIFRQALAFSITACMLCIVPYAMSLFLVTNLMLSGIGVALVVLYARAYSHVRSLLQEFQGHDVVVRAFAPLTRTVGTVMGCCLGFALASISFALAQLVGHGQHAYSATSYASAISLLVEYVAMYAFQITITRAAEVVVGPEQPNSTTTATTNTSPPTRTSSWDSKNPLEIIVQTFVRDTAASPTTQTTEMTQCSAIATPK